MMFECAQDETGAAGGLSDLTAVLGFPPVLDACCGSRMFWFDRKDERATFVDKRRERHTLPDISSKGGSRELVIDPDHLADFTDLPFPDNTFALVVFDPPHFERNGATGWVGLKYGTLKGDWRDELQRGFAECFRVLRPEGVLIFKWCEAEIPVSQILALTPERPLFGHRSGKQQKTHWMTFMKPNMGLSAHQRNGGHDEWLTPPEILQALGKFDLDPCAPIARPWNTADKHYTVQDDGLSMPWHGRVWCNPPFGREAIKWLRRMRDHGNGVALIPARTETAMFYETVWGEADGVLFMRGRPHFHYVDGRRADFNSGAPIALVAYGRDNLDALQRSGLGFVVIGHST